MTHTCPRRYELGHRGEQDSDEWVTSGGYLRCTFCGSLDPETFMTRVRNGEPMTPTDKNYKIYAGGHQKFYFQHLDKQQMIEFVNLYNDSTRKYFYVLPYFMKGT